MSIVQTPIVPDFSQDCIPDCGQFCPGCCMYIATELCPPWREDCADCATCSREDPECFLLYIRLDDHGAGCEMCCDEQFEDGSERCKCQGAADPVGNCSGSCAGHGCFPENNTPLLYPVYRHNGKCYVVRRAPLSDGQPPLDGGYHPCSVIDELTDDPDCSWASHPWFQCQNASGQGCFITVMPWCSWAAEYVGLQGPETTELCECLPCQDEPPTDCCDWGACPDDEMLQCCEFNKGGTTECKCLPRNDPQGNPIDCEGFPTGPCYLGEPCCDQFENPSAHYIYLTVDVETAFDYGGLCACGGGAEDVWPESFGGVTYEKVFDNPDDNPFGGEGQADLACGSSPDVRRTVYCAKIDQCGAKPSTPSVGPRSSPTMRAVPNCGKIDEECCNQNQVGSGCDDGTNRITDFVECNFMSNIPWCDEGDSETCPKGCSMYGDRHLGFKCKIEIKVQCVGSSGSNYFEVFGMGSIDVPMVTIGHFCNSSLPSGGVGGCSAPQCSFGGSPGSNIYSSSIGTQGSVNVPGEWAGYFSFAPNGGDSCVGTATMVLGFEPYDSNLYGLAYSFSMYNARHPCNGGDFGTAFYDFAYQVQQANEWIGSGSEAIAVMENCGVTPPDLVAPDGPIYNDVLAAWIASNETRTSFNALELASTAQLLNGFVNSPGGPQTFFVDGFSGCDLSNATHGCDLCPGKATSLSSGGFVVGKINSSVRMGYS